MNFLYLNIYFNIPSNLHSFMNIQVYIWCHFPLVSRTGFNISYRADMLAMNSLSSYLSGGKKKLFHFNFEGYLLWIQFWIETDLFQHFKHSVSLFLGLYFLSQEVNSNVHLWSSMKFTLSSGQFNIFLKTNSK